MIPRKAMWLLVAAYAGVIASMRGLPWGDLPNHLTRITIIGDLLFSPAPFFRQHYSFEWMFSPYLLWDVLAALTSRVLPVEANGLLWTLLTFFAVVAGGWYLARVRLRAAADRDVLTCFSVLLATNWCFAWGFFAFQLSIALCLFAVAFGWRFREAASRSGRWATYLVYAVLVAGCYLAHLGGFLPLCLILGAAALARVFQNWRNLPSEGLLLAPALSLAAWHAYLAWSLHAGLGEVVFRTPFRKFLTLAAPWLRFPWAWELPLLLGLGLAISALFARRILSGARPALRALFADDSFLAVVLLGTMYIALPDAGFNGWGVDMRMLPFLVYFLLLWLLRTGPASSERRLANRLPSPGLILFATCWVTLLIVFVKIRPYDAEARVYWQALKRIPKHRVVLPVPTRPYMGRLSPLHHQGVLYAAFREGISPYVFDRAYAAPFFALKERYSLPNNLWYVRNLPTPDWDRVRSVCDYLVVSKPFDPKRLPSPPAPVFFENEAAVVFQLKPASAIE